MDAYLDIETTGLSCTRHFITVIGVAFSEGDEIFQLKEESISRKNLLQVLEAASIIYTYNGTRFDLPFIRHHLNVDLISSHHHRDLMYDCWRLSLYGGLKAIEKQLGIKRKLPGINGKNSITLWDKYQATGNREYLDTLLLYNREDVLNLRILHRYIEIRNSGDPNLIIEAERT